MTKKRIKKPKYTSASSLGVATESLPPVYKPGTIPPSTPYDPDKPKTQIA